MARIDKFLKLVNDINASDLHLVAGSPPILRVHGELSPIDNSSVIGHEECKSLIFEILTDRQRKIYEETKDLDCAYSVSGLARFRVNVFQQRKGIGAVFRLIPTTILPLKELGLPPVLERFARLNKGLVLVTGPTGSGKSTTLASIIDIINREMRGHIITVEEPIEFIHNNKNCLVTQREVGLHAESFASAMRVILREDPDIILVGEMRDLETISLTLSAAETGTLVFATVHTNSASKTIDRLVDVFPEREQDMVRIQLATSLKGVIAQQLLRKADQMGRVVATEVMVCNYALSNLIREGKTFLLPSAIQSGRSEGMITMDQSLIELVKQRKITEEVGWERALDKEGFSSMMARLQG
ncbi:MAG: type IV pilus twitching motility protein PilT [Deltaproteobacteria bacterium]|nr:MAG: type IV pilus twitching motility protein PilT [Deltaproteobacteria bacterium]